MIKTVLLGFSALGMLAATPAAAKMLDPDKPEDAVEIMKRAQCGAKDGTPAVYHWSGKVYSRVEGEPDRLLFTGEGSVDRVLYDPDSDEVIRSPDRFAATFLLRQLAGERWLLTEVDEG